MYIEIMSDTKAIMLQKIIKIPLEMMFLQLILCRGSNQLLLSIYQRYIAKNTQKEV